MEIVILGSGTATPSLERNASGLAVQTEKLIFLVDIGPGTLRRMCEAQIDSRLVDAILITHFHPDHTSDLVAFLFASNYAFGPVREDPFYIVGPTGFKGFYASLQAVWGDWIVPKNNRLKVKEMDAETSDGLLIDEVTILSMPSPHSFPSISYRIEEAGKSVTVSGDTDISEGLVELAMDTDVLICECSMPEESKIPGHLVPSEAGAMAEKARAQKLVLTHMYPPCEEVDVAEQASRSFLGEVLKAADLMKIKV
jgi:ribonuclease BN (tRNA processing enzyme)